MNKKMMKKTESVVLMVLLFGVIFASCQLTPKSFVNSFERFVERVEKNAPSYSREQWNQNDEELSKYMERYDREKQRLSSEDKRKVGELTVRYYKVRIKYMGFNMIGEIGDWLDFVKGFADEIMKDINNYQNNE